MFTEFLHRFDKLLIGGGTKVADADISDSWPDDVCSVNALDGNLVAYDSERQLILDAAAHHAELYLCILGTAQTFHDFLFRHLHTRNGCVVDADNAVAGNDAHLF